jgi:hypothetical protein
MATKDHKGDKPSATNRLRAYRRNEVIAGTKAIFEFFCG